MWFKIDQNKKYSWRYKVKFENNDHQIAKWGDDTAREMMEV